MLTPSTLHHLAHYTCPACQKPLGRFHAYGLQPSQLLSLTSEGAPMHLTCAENDQQDALALTSPDDSAHRVTVIAVVKAAPRSPSARIIRLHPDDASTTLLHLFTPERLHFHVLLKYEDSIVCRPATHEEVFTFLEPSIQAAIDAAAGNAAMLHELTRHLGWIQHVLKRPA